MFGSIQRKKLAEELNLAPHLEILLVVALGKPKETIKLDKVDEEHGIKYWRDEKQVHHVPKRELDDIIISL